MEPLRSGLKLFREDFERHIREKKCPWKYNL
jgi:NADH-quinone oxidoreductase subunit F